MRESKTAPDIQAVATKPCSPGTVTFQAKKDHVNTEKLQACPTSPSWLIRGTAAVPVQLQPPFALPTLLDRKY